MEDRQERSRYGDGTRAFYRKASHSWPIDGRAGGAGTVLFAASGRLAAAEDLGDVGRAPAS